MIELEEALVSRLQEHEERLKQHRAIVERQREWLIQRNQPHVESHVAQLPPTASEPTPTPEPIEDRLIKKGMDQRRKIEMERERVEMERQEKEKSAMQSTVRTKSNRDSSHIVRPVKHSVSLISQNVATGTPQISLMSEKIAQSRRIRDGLHGVDIADSLLIRGEQSKEEAWLRLQQQAAREHPGSPSITRRAAALQRPEDASIRLYASHTAKVEHPKEDLRCLIEETLEDCTPKITAKAKSLTRREGHSVCEDLYRDGVRLKATRESRARTPPARATPRINPVSDMIASQLQMSAVERLQQPRRSAAVNAPPFRPSISLESKRIAAVRRNEGTSRFDSLHQDSFRRSACINDKINEKSAHETDGCTFHPAVSHKAQVRRDDADPLLRMSNWVLRKDQRLEDMRLKQLEEQERECTFQPRINSQPVEDTDSTVYGGDGHAWGYHDFVDRHSAARQRKDDDVAANASVFVDGSGWKNEVTTPAPPNITCFRTHDARPTARAQAALQSAIDVLREAEAASGA